MNLILSLIMISANVLGGAMAFPQARRLARTRRPEGVSPAWVGISVAMNMWWLAYGIAAERWALVPVSVISVCLYGAIGAALLATVGRSCGRELLLAFAALALAPLPFLLIGGWPAAGVAIGVGYGVQLLPAVISAFRSDDLRGVSAGTWLIAGAESLLWAVYGLIVADSALVIAGVAGVLMSAIILLRLALTGHLNRSPAVARWRNPEPELSW
jgi:uncharacterized protein with PQ loop repeat